MSDDFQNSAPDQRLSDQRLQELVSRAREASERSLPLFAGTTQVGAAALFESGAVFEGSYYAAASGYYTVHAEHAAIVHAAIHGEHQLIALAVFSAATTATSGLPCGTCLQLIADIGARCGTSPTIVCSGPDRRVRRFCLNDLLPHPWRMDD